MQNFVNTESSVSHTLNRGICLWSWKAIEWQKTGLLSFCFWGAKPKLSFLGKSLYQNHVWSDLGYVTPSLVFSCCITINYRVSQNNCALAKWETKKKLWGPTVVQFLNTNSIFGFPKCKFFLRPPVVLYHLLYTSE